VRNKIKINNDIGVKTTFLSQQHTMWVICGAGKAGPFLKTFDIRVHKALETISTEQ
jgi:hypothetical protein